MRFSRSQDFGLFQYPKPQSELAIDANSAWRREIPGIDGWTRTARPDDPNKYFMVSMDEHVQEPFDLWQKRMDKQYQNRLPGVSTEKKGNKFQKTEGFRPVRIRNIKFEGEDTRRIEARASSKSSISNFASRLSSSKERTTRLRCEEIIKPKPLEFSMGCACITLLRTFSKYSESLNKTFEISHNLLISRSLLNQLSFPRNL